MNSKDKVRPFKKKSKTLLEKLMEKKSPEDLGLLDLLFVEEMMNQKNQEKSN